MCSYPRYKTGFQGALNTKVKYTSSPPSLGSSFYCVGAVVSDADFVAGFLDMADYCSTAMCVRLGVLPDFRTMEGHTC